MCVVGTNFMRSVKKRSMKCVLNFFHNIIVSVSISLTLSGPLRPEILHTFCATREKCENRSSNRVHFISFLSHLRLHTAQHDVHRNHNLVFRVCSGQLSNRHSFFFSSFPPLVLQSRVDWNKWNRQIVQHFFYRRAAQWSDDEDDERKEAKNKDENTWTHNNSTLGRRNEMKTSNNSRSEIVVFTVDFR